MPLTGKYRFMIFALWVVFTSNAFARQSDTTAVRDSTIINLEEIIVRGDQEKIEKQAIPTWLLSPVTPDVIDALDRIPGLSNVQSVNYPIVYRGQYGNRLRIEQNGNRRAGITPEGGYLADDINPGDVNSIKMITGVEKVIYGSGASGGVLKIDQFGHFNEKKDRLHEAYLSYGTNNRNRIAGFRSGMKGEHLNFFLTGRNQKAEDYQTPSQHTITNSAYYLNNVSAGLQYRDQAKKNVFNLMHTYSNGNRERPQGFQANPLELRNFRNRYTHQTSLEHTINREEKSKTSQRLSMLFLETNQVIDSYSSEMAELRLNRTRTYLKRAVDYDAKHRLHLGNQILTLGTDLYHSHQRETNNEKDFISGESRPEELTGIRREYQAGLFAMSDHSFDQFDLRTAIRFDRALIGNGDSLSDFGALTGGADLTWKQSDHLLSVISVGRFFRYPTPQEAMGVFFGGRGIFRGNPDIRPEYSHQAEWTIKSVIRKIHLQVTAFYHHFNDRITALPVADGSFLYENVEFARTKGIEFIAVQSLGDNRQSHQGKLTLTASMTRGDIMQGGNFSDQAEPMIGIPPADVRLGGQYIYRMRQNLVFRMAGDISRTADFHRIPERFINQTFAVVPTDGYWLVNLHPELEIQTTGTTIITGISIRNLTNSAYFPFGTRVMEMGRNVIFSVRVAF